MMGRDHLALVGEDTEGTPPDAIAPRVADLEFRLSDADARLTREKALRLEAEAQLAEARKEAAGGGQTRALGLPDAAHQPQTKTRRGIGEFEQDAINKGTANQPAKVRQVLRMADSIKGYIDRGFKKAGAKMTALEDDMRALSDLCAELEARLRRAEGRSDAE